MGTKAKGRWMMFIVLIERGHTLTRIGQETDLGRAIELWHETQIQRGTEGNVVLHVQLGHFDQIRTRGVA